MSAQADSKVSDQLARHLPFLRRFARSLLGSQSIGDAQVVKMLEALLRAPNSLDSAPSIKVGVYRLFLQTLNDTALADCLVVDPLASPAQQKINQLTPKPRQAFLLAMVEGFTEDEVAEILDVARDQVDIFLRQAGEEIAHQVATDVLIIEDEALIATDLKLIAKELGHRVIGVARTHKEAIDLAKALPPGLILADIQLADGSSGLDAVNEMLRDHLNAPVIFITSFPERLLTGRHPEPTFLLSKPYRTNTVKATMSQALFFEQCVHPSNNVA